MTSVLVTSLLQWSAAQLSVSPDVVTVAVGEGATLSVGYTGRVQYFIWFRGTGTQAANQILGVVGSAPPNYGPRYTGREAALPDGSLRIRDVQVNYTGSYTLLMNTDPGGLQEATVQLRVYGSPGSTPAPAPCSCWQTTLGVACGVLLGAVIIVAGMAVHYKRLLDRKGTNKDENVHQNPRVIRNSNTQYGNVRKGHEGQSVAQSRDAGHTYIALQLGDQTTYDHLQRPQD